MFAEDSLCEEENIFIIIDYNEKTTFSSNEHLTIINTTKVETPEKGPT